MADGGGICFRAQKGQQEAFLASSADIVIYGGAAGGGKTYGLLLEILRHVNNPKFGAVIFRRESTQITNEGGLWDTAGEMYSLCGGKPLKSPKMIFKFPSGARVTFDHLNREDGVKGWQGSQIPLICFDELTHFERSQFFYMLSRNRSMCGVRPYIRATCNPDADSWVAEFIAWWIDQDTGYAIKERSGVLRWFCRVDDTIHWDGDPFTLAEKHGVAVSDCKSVTFIAASITDNPALMAADPGYLANLRALGRVERERLLGGNWKIKPAAGMYFLRGEARILPADPGDCIAWARSWDLAATEAGEDNTDPDWTAGVKLGRRICGRIVVLDVKRCRRKSGAVRTLVKATADADGAECWVSIPEDPGQAGKEQAASYVAMLQGHRVKVRRATEDKVTRAEPVSSAWQAGGFDVVQGPWTEAFLSELEGFPELRHDDQVDALSDAHAILPKHKTNYAVAGERTF